MLDTLKKIFVLISSAALCSCSLMSTQQVHDKTKVIKIYNSYEPLDQCTFISELVGSEGTWYNYLFLSNKALTLGTVNDLKNQANAIGANAIQIQFNLDFNTSVTFFAQAYYCSKPLTIELPTVEPATVF